MNCRSSINQSINQFVNVVTSLVLNSTETFPDNYQLLLYIIQSIKIRYYSVRKQ